MRETRKEKGERLEERERKDSAAKSVYHLSHDHLALKGPKMVRKGVQI